MKILLIGSGGREHAIAASLLKSPHCTDLFVAPGNGGTAQIARNIDISATNVPEMVNFAVSEKIDLVFVASDDPLALGMVDAMENAGIRAFGPRQNAAIIESSKAFSKAMMKKYGIPTAAYEIFDDAEKAIRYCATLALPIVIKADGLALGKGVVIAQSLSEAENAIREMMLEGKFGSSGNRVVVEEFLEGHETTVLAFTDGRSVKLMPSAQDHKRAHDNDEGLNTGGMGVISPSPFYTEDIASLAERDIFVPTIAAMRSEGREFRGVIYFELMITNKGPYVIEYNARFGDPEAQAVLPLLKSDLLDICLACTFGTLDSVNIMWEQKASCCVVLASLGYPESYEKGFPIEGIESAASLGAVYHAGTKLTGGGIVTNGGRVLGVTATGASLREAIDAAYTAADKIKCGNLRMRRDIGKKALDNLIQ